MWSVYKELGCECQTKQNYRINISNIRALRKRTRRANHKIADKPTKRKNGL